jgi:hypothetical protein
MNMAASSSFVTIEQAFALAMRKRVLAAIGASDEPATRDEYVTLVAELLTWDSLQGGGQLRPELRQAARTALALMRDGGPDTQSATSITAWQLRTASLAILADVPQEAGKLLAAVDLEVHTNPSRSWLHFVRETVSKAWLGLMRHGTVVDVQRAQEALITLRELQLQHEKPFLERCRADDSARLVALELLALYFLGTAAERLSEYFLKGIADGGADINAQLDMYFDRALHAVDKAVAAENLDIALLLQPVAHQLANASIRSATRGANALTRQFAEMLVARPHQPLFQLLPPQRAALREEGFIGNAQRSVVVSFPTSSGKTLIAEFAVLQALNDLGQERGWVAYVAPTRALVNQVTNRLRRDFEPLGKRVERLSPALEFDSVELSTLRCKDASVDGPPVDVLVCTPEKLDLLIRRDDLQNHLGRLALLVVDEAHGLGAKGSRAIKLELLLSMINREQEHVRFLLLTPFISNAKRVAQWLDQTSNKDYSIEADWVPNDRIVGVVSPPDRAGTKRGQKAGTVLFKPVSTPKKTLHIDETLELAGLSPELGFSVAKLHSSVGALATSTAQILSTRGPTVMLCRTVADTWKYAEDLSRATWPILEGGEDREAVARFVSYELGTSTSLSNMLLAGLAVHHAGLPEEVAQAIEWLFENRRLHVLCATTTLAQGVNFPIANLVLASIYSASGYGEPMPYSEFWNIAGRVGRVDQDAIGVVALTAKDDVAKDKSIEFLKRSMADLVSTLLEMVGDLSSLSVDQGLEALVWKKEWSNFSQFIAHTLRHVGVAKFADQIELVLRGTLGYQTLRETNVVAARQLLSETRKYANRIAGDMGSVKLVDSTGFSFESVRSALGKLGQLGDLDDLLAPDRLFSGKSKDLQEVMGVLLTIPEVRDDLVDSSGGHGGKIAEMLADWVHGMPIPGLAKKYFATDDGDEDAISTCVRKFKRLSMTSSWGLASVMAMKFGGKIDDLPAATRQMVTNIPSMVLYGVWTHEQIALRSAGVPRAAATELAKHIESASTSYLLNKSLVKQGSEPWISALGKERGADYYRVWQILKSA